MIDVLAHFKKDIYYIGKLSITELLPYFKKHCYDIKDGVIKYTDQEGNIHIIKCVRYYYETPAQCKDCPSVIRHHQIPVKEVFSCNDCHLKMHEKYRAKKVSLKKQIKKGISHE